jgi:hypothetical protein
MAYRALIFFMLYSTATGLPVDGFAENILQHREPVGAFATKKKKLLPSTMLTKSQFPVADGRIGALRRWGTWYPFAIVGIKPRC